MSAALPEAFVAAGLGPEALTRIDELVVAVGGAVRELLAYSRCSSTAKDVSGERLSAADHFADRLLCSELQALVPGSHGYSEEQGAFGERPAGLQVSWLIDPLDGTRSATQGGVYAVSVGALVSDGETPIAAAGWVYVPPLGTLYRALLAGDFAECLANGEPATLLCVDATDLKRRYLAVESNGRGGLSGDTQIKITAPGATAVHLTQLVQPGSDVAAVYLARYRPFDAAGGLVVAAAAGAACFSLGSGDAAPEADDPLSVLGRLYALQSGNGWRMLVAHPAVAAAMLG